MDKIEIKPTVTQDVISRYYGWTINNKISLVDFLSHDRRQNWNEMSLASKWKIGTNGIYSVYAFYTPPIRRQVGYYHSFLDKLDNFEKPAWDEPYHEIIREFISNGSSVYVFPEAAMHRTIVLTLDE